MRDLSAYTSEDWRVYLRGVRDVQSCGHPLSARVVRTKGGDLWTTCWVCELAGPRDATRHADKGNGHV